jgi:hypothetical protein
MRRRAQFGRRQRNFRCHYSKLRLFFGDSKSVCDHNCCGYMSSVHGGYAVQVCPRIGNRLALD